MLINGRFLARQPTGVDRFAGELLRASADACPSLRWEVAVPAPGDVSVPWPGEFVVKATGRLSGHAWEQIDLPRASMGRALVNLCNTGPVLCERQMAVIHDAGIMANPANYSRAFRAWYQAMLYGLMRRARVVATVSKFSADELNRHFGRGGKRPLEVIGEGGEHILRAPADERLIDRLGLRGRRFVLAVGSKSPNKNLAAVVQAVNALKDEDVLLVAAGGGNSRVFASAEVEHDRLRYTGYVSDAELRALYEHALCFAFPSFYEGFGLPPLEAMCCGCPVVVSERASLPEICGAAALYCDPSDPATLARQLQRLVDSPALRAELREAGRAQAGLFGWDKAARQFAELMTASFADSDDVVQLGRALDRAVSGAHPSQALSAAAEP